jgi:predicted ATPase
MITKIEVENYRCFPRLSVYCGPYQVLAGANGAGKSTLLDIVPLVGDLLDAHRVTEAFLQRVGSRQTPRATQGFVKVVGWCLAWSEI